MGKDTSASTKQWKKQNFSSTFQKSQNSDLNTVKDNISVKNAQRQARSGKKSQRKNVYKLLYQKSNPILPPQYTQYPQGAIPDIQKPEKSLQLISTKQGTPIENPLTALGMDSPDQYVSFDEAIDLIKHKELLKEGEQVLYVGKGRFSIVSYEIKEGKTTMQIVRTIEFENQKDVPEWKKKLQYGIHLVQIDKAAPLSELYTRKEIDSFAEYNTG